MQLETFHHPSHRDTALVGGLFLGGMAAGVGAAHLFAPGSPLAILIGFMALPLSFGLGMSLWYSVANADMIRKVMRALLQTARTGDLNNAIREEFLAFYASPIVGTRIFVPVTLVIMFSSGVAISFCPSAGDVSLVVSGFSSMGLAYGMLVTRLARTGILPSPKSN